MIDSVEMKDVKYLADKSCIIDIREPYELNQGYIEGARNIPMGILLMDPDNYLDKKEKYYIVCQSGGRSGRACMMLAAKGFDVVNVIGGMYAY